MVNTAKTNRNWGPEDIGNFYTFGWLQAWLAVEGIKLALNKVGWENLSGRAVREGLTSVTNIDTGFGFMATVSDSKLFLSKDRVYHIENGKNIPVSDFIDPIYTYKELIESK